jgi:dihydroorotate dehydrogenase
LLIKVPLDEAADMAEAAANAPADALVIGAPPAGAAMTGSGEIISGDLYGPALYSLALQQVRLVTAVVDAPIVAAGGVHSESDARALIDSLIFVDPLAVAEIARAFDDSC